MRLGSPNVLCAPQKIETKPEDLGKAAFLPINVIFSEVRIQPCHFLRVLECELQHPVMSTNMKRPSTFFGHLGRYQDRMGFLYSDISDLNLTFYQYNNGVRLSH